MIKQILATSIIFTIFGFFSEPVQAKEFTSNYEVTYDVQESGITRVEQNIDLKNLTSEFYAHEYTLTVNSETIENISASDSRGRIEPQIERGSYQTKITLAFNSKVVGSGSIQSFRIAYDSKEFASNHGQVWEIIVPRLSNAENIDLYRVNVQVPTSFGPSVTAHPKADLEIESAGKRVFQFNKEAIENFGAILSFGETQYYSFELKYHLKNPTNGPVRTQIALPPDIINRQKVYFRTLNPTTVNVEIDEDGNYLALYELAKGEAKTITLTGIAEVKSTKNLPAQTNSSEQIPEDILNRYTKELPFWPTTDPKIIQLAESITKDHVGTYNKSHAIYNYVIEELTYSKERLQNNVERFGALKALEFPDQAVCMEYADLFITLNRAVGIPAREIDGYAYTPDDDSLPTIGDVLHAWTEVYLPDTGWVPVDPTWGSTTKGLDYFQNFDTNHFSFSIKGLDSEWPYPAGAYKLSPDQTGDINVTFASVEEIEEFKRNHTNLILELEVNEKQISGLPIRAEVVIRNSAPQSVSAGVLTILATDQASQEFKITAVPPLGEIRIPININTPRAWIGKKTGLNASFKFTDNQGNSQNYAAEKEIDFRPLYLTVWVIPVAIFFVVTLLYTILWILKARQQNQQTPARPLDHPRQDPDQ
jgi:transglutaminase-like putative cysteine protease